MTLTPGKWVWITEHTLPSTNPTFNWQARQPVTSEMVEFYCAAWRSYDNSDASDTPIGYEESILASHAVTQIENLLETLQMIADFAVGNGDVCEVIARRARAAIRKATEGTE